VCLEECQEEYSPCECKIPIHHKCFVELTNLQNCTVCKEIYIFEDIEIIHEPQEHIIVLQKKTTKGILFPFLVGILLLFVSWYFSGLVGKAIWVISGGKLIDNVYEFWNKEHAIASSIMMFCFMTFYVLRCCNKRSSVAITTV